uniref:Reverse transcriptase domain-containing protein n=1 Tax=Phytophthora ramorum TaxID=164328 RepID=H3GV16_PHYRM
MTGGKAVGRSRANGPLECDRCWFPAASWVNECAGCPAGDAVERVDIGHAALKIVSPSESQSHCKKQDDKPNLVILKEFVDELIVLELDDKFDMVLGMPCKPRHDPVIDWTKRTIVRFGSSSSATESDGPVGAAHAPRVEVKKTRRLWEPTLQAVRTVANVPHRKCLRARVQPGCTTKRCAIKPGLNACARGERRKREKLRKSRSGTETLQVVSAGQTQELETTVETLSVLTRTSIGLQYKKMRLDNPPTLASELMSLPVTSWKRFARELHDGRIEQICILSDVERMTCEAEELNQLISEGADALSTKSKKERFDEQGWDSLKASPFYKVLREYKDVLRDDIPAELPQDKGVQHEIDLVPGTKYCVTRQWPLPREQVKAIDDFFESRRKAGQVRESKSPHSAPTFCVKKPQGGWRIDHAYNKLNDATVPAQTPIPRKDVIIDSMTSSTIFSTLDLRDGFYQILMRESDIPLTAVSTPSGMLWEWLVMPQGLKNAPATFNRCVTHLLRSVRDFAPSYFDDVFIHSRAVNGRSDVEMHTEHLRKLLELMRKHKLYANLKKCIFGATEIPVLGCLVGKNGVRPDPGKVRVINEWPTPSNVKELRQFLGLATYLCKYVSNYAGKIRPLSQLLKKEAAWEWTADCQQAFEAVKQGLTEAPILAVADQDRPFHVVCDASDFAIGCALMQLDHEGRDRVVYYQSRQLKPAERNYPVHDKELLAMNAVDDNADRIVVPDDHELKLKITYEYHDAPTSGHPGREKTYLLLTRDFYWSHQYKWVRKYVRACELSMSTADHPQTDGQTERVNRVLVDTMKSYAHSFHQWSDCLPMVEFAINNSVHVSTGHTPFYVNAMRHPRVPSVLVMATMSTTGVDTSIDNEQHAQAGPAANKEHELNQGFSSDAMDFVQRRQAVIRFVQDAIAASVDRQKLNADNTGRKNTK